MPVDVRPPSEGELLQEAAALVSRVLGERVSFHSRGQFFDWFQRGGQSKLVKTGAMKQLQQPSPYSALEWTVGLLRMFTTQKPKESYERALAAVCQTRTD